MNQNIPWLFLRGNLFGWDWFFVLIFFLLLEFDFLRYDIHMFLLFLCQIVDFMLQNTFGVLEFKVYLINGLEIFLEVNHFVRVDLKLEFDFVELGFEIFGFILMGF